MFQLSLVYGFSGLSKLNEDFMSGQVLAGVLRGGIVPFPEALVTPRFLSVLAALAVMTELFIALFIWSKRFRPAAFILGLGFHVSLILLMAPTGELAVFALQMLALYPLFLSSDSLVLVWDDECASCADWVTRFRRLDLLNVLTLIGKREIGHDVPREEVERSLHLIHGGIKVQGFRAVAWTLEHLVPTIWFAPILRFPGVTPIGERWYRWQASRRACAVGQKRGVDSRADRYS
jgi:predicted DCC family thiol-disulfide oxidoreductase YuxK